MKLEKLKLQMKRQNEEILDSLDKLSMIITGSEATEQLFEQILEKFKPTLKQFKEQKNSLKVEIDKVAELVKSQVTQNHNPIELISNRLELLNKCLTELRSLIPKYEPELASF